ncbi:hypothetical protein WMF18_30470 [Sorangium sp. So ce315]|uniref:hypothetical protein n=1 Tax=Sorangium sp. So ce315 TaxID=3133299 RepID=UPI003F5E55B2
MRRLFSSEETGERILRSGSYKVNAEDITTFHRHFDTETPEDTPESAVRPPALESAAPQAPSPPPHDASGSPSSGRRSLAFVIGGVCAAALGGSLITGGLALGTKGELEEECPTPSQCSDRGMSLRSRGQTLTTAGSVLGALGLAGIGAGLVLLLTTPEQGTSVALAPAILPGGGGALLRSRF